jgi:hypothetical protein
MFNKKRLLLFVFIIAGLILVGLFVNRGKINNWRQDLFTPKITLPTAIDYQALTINEKVEPVATTTTKDIAPIEQAIPETKLADKINLNVPFISQAPSKNWNATFKEACEEASILMAKAYFEKTASNIKTDEQNILNLVAWQEQNLGGHFDLTTEQTADLVQKNWPNYQVEVIKNIDIEAIKKFLNQGLPVIIPAAGRELGNPHFKTPGPIYHMLVIKGYQGNDFITNDPGTQYGADYLYNQEKLISAIHDWFAEDILQGEKNALIVRPL